MRDTLGDGADAALIDRIVDHADGNPFHLEELVRAVVAGRGEAFRVRENAETLALAAACDAAKSG